MKQMLIVAVVFVLGMVADRMLGGVHRNAEAEKGQAAGAERCAEKNGDVNASGAVDLSDAVTILGNLFLGSPTELLPLCSSSAARGMPATGQTQCTDCSGQPTQCLDCTGRPRTCEGFTEDFLTLQDSFQRRGCPSEGRFTDNGDGTVTDNCTGLQWQKDKVVINGAELIVNWCEALAFCKNLSLAGHDDWRLPNIRELESIVDYGRFGPASDPVFEAPLAFYWSSTTVAFFVDKALLIGFGDGLAIQGGKGNGGRVRAVRGP